MRVLVLTGSSLFPGLIDALTPQSVVVDSANSFDGARRLLAQNAPDAVIVDKGICERGLCRWTDVCAQAAVGLECREIQSACNDHRPRIPVLVDFLLYPATTAREVEESRRSTGMKTLPMLKAGLAHLIQEVAAKPH